MENMEHLEQGPDSMENMEHLEQGPDSSIFSDGSNDNTQSTNNEQSSLVDLDQVEKFKWKGKELTRAELKKATLMHSDYTQKTQKIAQERKYFDNLSADLNAVKRNPSLAERFRSVYPEKFHQYLTLIASENQEKIKQQEQPNQGIDLSKYDEKLDRMEKYILEKETSAISANLDRIFSDLGKKYPFAATAEDLVINYVDNLIQKGHEIDDKGYEQVFKYVNDRIEKIAMEKVAQKQNKQISLNKSAGDAPGGGGLPGQAPKTPRTIKEATRILQDDIRQGSVRF